MDIYKMEQITASVNHKMEQFTLHWEKWIEYATSHRPDLFCNQYSDVKKDHSLYVHSFLSCPPSLLYMYIYTYIDICIYIYIYIYIPPPNFLLNVYRTYVTGAYMSTCRYINTCKMNVDLYVLRYECIQMYNV